MITILLLILFITVLWLIELKRRKLSALVKHIPGPKGDFFTFLFDLVRDGSTLDYWSKSGVIKRSIKGTLRSGHSFP